MNVRSAQKVLRQVAKDFGIRHIKAYRSDPKGNMYAIRINADVILLTIIDLFQGLYELGIHESELNEAAAWLCKLVICRQRGDFRNLPLPPHNIHMWGTPERARYGLSQKAWDSVRGKSPPMELSGVATWP